MRLVYTGALLALFALCSISTVIGAPLSGSYTINVTQATSGTNFQTFSAFANALMSNGVSGPVVVTVAAGTGPYLEQVEIDSIPGVSAVNTVTIDGNNSIIQFNATGVQFSEYYTIRIGADYVTLTKLHVKALNANNGIGIHITNDAQHVTVSECTVEVSTTNRMHR
jgi:trimeric autotransporter adhesin